jgi:serine/threonine kinase 32
MEPSTKSASQPQGRVSPSSSKASSETPNSQTADTRKISSSHKPTTSAPSSGEGSPPVEDAHPNRKRRSAKRVNSDKSNQGSPFPATPPQQGRVGRPSRITSAGGGIQVVLGETGSWSDLAKQDATLPADAALTTKPNGMLGFLSRKKGRGHSPKPQERGILGKEGARVVISP